jgi:hypothetical protein
VTAETRELLKLMAMTGCPLARIALHPDMGAHAEAIFRQHPPAACPSAKETFRPPITAER